MEFQTVTYAAQPVDYSIGEEPSDSSSHLTDGLAAFLLRVAAYFQGCLASLPRVTSTPQPPASALEDAPENVPKSLTVIDPALDGTSEPLIKVRMNRALSRRMRWLMKRGRVQRSGRLRVYNSDTETRCNLTPGQMSEYCIRVYRESRSVAYGLNRGGHIANKGGVLSLGVAGICAAILMPD